MRQYLEKVRDTSKVTISG